MSLTKIGREQQEHGNYHIYGKDFDPNDPLSELEALYMPKKEAPKKAKTEKEKKIEELNRLNRLLCERNQEFEKAKGKRMTITVLVFTAFYFFVLMILSGNTELTSMIKSVANADIWEIFGMVFGSLFFAVIHVLVNATIFGHLSAKGREENEILDNIRKRISELEKNL